MRGDARPVVLHLEDHAPVVPRSGEHGHPAVPAAVTDGVVHQVGEHLAQPGLVGPRHQPGGDPDQDGRDAVGGGHLPGHVPDQRGEVDRRRVELAVAALGTGQVEQVLHERAQPLRLREGLRQGGAVSGPDTVQEVLQLCAQRRDRGAQLVGDVGQQGAALSVGGRELGRHVRERPRQPTDLVAAAGGHGRRGTTGGHGGGGGRHLPQRGGHPVREDLGQHERSRHGRRQGPPGAGAHQLQAHRGHEEPDGQAGHHHHAELELDGADRVERT